MAAYENVHTRQGTTYTSKTIVWEPPAGSPLVSSAAMKWRAGLAPGSTVLLSLTSGGTGAAITLSSVSSGSCTIVYVIPAATLLAIAAGNFYYDLLVTYTDGTTVDCVVLGEVQHDQIMTQ